APAATSTGSVQGFSKGFPSAFVIEIRAATPPHLAPTGKSMRNNQPVTGRENILRDDIAIISRTDERGIIEFCNEDFLEASGYSRDELIGQPHNILRYPDMPAEAFQIGRAHV